MHCPLRWPDGTLFNRQLHGPKSYSVLNVFVVLAEAAQSERKLIESQAPAERQKMLSRFSRIQVPFRGFRGAPQLIVNFHGTQHHFHRFLRADPLFNILMDQLDHFPNDLLSVPEFNCEYFT